MNRLAAEKSSYLQHAADQKIDWYPWGAEPFEKARKENKPVFLSSGAVWCHWCHVMAKESFYDDEVARILNEHYVSIKLDRDERPDIDRRYQRALAGMGVAGGWPLSIFLTPDKRPFFGGTYFPPYEKHGKPAFITMLTAIAQLYREKRSEVENHCTELMKMINPSSPGQGSINEAMIDHALSVMLEAQDRTYGGFGSAPKFPMSGSLEFLLARYWFSGDKGLRSMLTKTLTAMAQGGFCDQLAGGFHRYSTDPLWIVPHFEKMTDDNAWLLRNYVQAFALFGDPLYRETALGIIDFVTAELTDEKGGFYASQDADVTPDDEGGYFTWTEDEFRTVLTKEESDLLSAYYLNNHGIVHHDATKHVLYVSSSLDRVAVNLGITPPEARDMLERGRKKLLAFREQRTKPFVDKAIYTSLNGMMIAAFLKAWRGLGREDAKVSALAALARIIDTRSFGPEVFHCEGIRGMLDDYAYLIDALIEAYEATGDQSLIERADTFMSHSIDLFWDREGSGFFDTEDTVIGLRLKGVEDIPHPSANAVSIGNLIRLAHIVDRPEYRDYAEKALRGFAGYAQVMGLHGGYFFSALDLFFMTADVTIDAPFRSDLAEQIRSLPYPYTVIRYGSQNGTATLCMKNACHEPVTDAGRLAGIMAGYRQNG